MTRLQAALIGFLSGLAIGIGLYFTATEQIRVLELEQQIWQGKHDVDSIGKYLDSLTKQHQQECQRRPDTCSVYVL